MQSIVGYYQEGGNKEGGEYVEDREHTSGTSEDTKIKTKNDIMTGAAKLDARSQLFREMESKPG